MLMLKPASILMLEASRRLLLQFQTGNAGLDALERAAQAEVGRMAIFHHDPSHDDAFMDHILEFCQKTIAERNYPYSCFVAQEGMSVEL